MLKFVIFIVAAFVLFKLVTGDKKKKSVDKKKEEEKLHATGAMVKDPVCGTYVANDSDIRVREGDKVHHFCSYECRDKFLKRIEADKPEAEPSESEKAESKV
jgi:YHS domain-containing protein